MFFAFQPDEMQECFGEALRKRPLDFVERQQLGFIWGHTSDAIGISDSGKPTFASYNVFHKRNLHEFGKHVDDLEKVAETLRQMPADIRAEAMQRMLDDSKEITSLAERILNDETK